MATAILPDPKLKMAAGNIGAWANMEECNSFTGFAESEFGFGVPLTFGTTAGANMNVKPLTTGNVFRGISLANTGTSGTPVSGQARYGIGQSLGVADEGVIFVRAGAGVVKGAKPFYEVATGLWHGATATGRLPIPGCYFDDAATSGDPVALKIRVNIDAPAVTAAT